MHELIHPAQVVDWECTSTSGWTLVALIVGGGGLYVGIGVLFGAKTGGKPVALGSHPHCRQWHELRSLALDGLWYARGRAQGRGAGHEPIRCAATAGDERDGGAEKAHRGRARSSQRDKSPTAKRDRKTKSSAEKARSHEERAAVGETVILLHPLLPAVGVSIGMERARQQSDRTLADG